MHPTTLDGRYFVVEGQPMIVVAPRLFRYASSLDFPVAAVTVYPAAARNAEHGGVSHALMEEVETFFNGLAMLDHKLRSLKSSVKSSLRLAVHPAYGNFLAPMAIARFRQKLDVPVFFEVCSSASAYQRVHSGEIDFGIDGICDITLESRVLGGASYASGVSKIVSSAMTNQLENRTYLVDEFVTNRWI